MATVKNKTAKKEEIKAEYGCCCFGHGYGYGYGKKPIVIGIMLFVIGAALANHYTFPEVLMLVGGLLIVKGILIAAFKKD